MAERSGGVDRVGMWLVVVMLGIGVGGCFMRDPLDPRGELGHRAIQSFDDAERAARSRAAFEHARERVHQVLSGMTIPEVEAALEATVVSEHHDDVKENEAPRRKFIDGLLCRRNPSPLRQRWVFGYDEDGVELVGFVLEFARDDPEKERWVVRSIDRDPSDDCPDPGE